MLAVPGSTPAAEVLAEKPDGVFLSNGPGDPAALEEAVANLRAVLGERPVFGICLGHQLLGLALGCETYKMPFGHHGANHPVRNLRTGRIEITSQNHGFAVGEETLPEGVELTHRNLYDGTVEGLASRELARLERPVPSGVQPRTTRLGLPLRRVRGRDLVERRPGCRRLAAPDDIASILIIGSGPIVIGQAAEFDYSGTQACRALRDEGYRVILVNSNPATIMTDPEIADATYVEPLTAGTVAEIIRRERPDALLPTLGGQTALNLAIELHESGILDEYGVELLGASVYSIRKAEDRQLFRDAMDRIGLRGPGEPHRPRPDEAQELAREIGFPLIIRPSFTLGGKGGGDRLRPPRAAAAPSPTASTPAPVRSALVEQSVAGWKEFELEVMRDLADNVVVICSIENVDPMGVHTGDSITVAPAQTLSDRQYQTLRTASLRIIREIGVQTGGSNIQFAVEPGGG